MLDTIQTYVQDCATVIAKITGIPVEIIDADLIRIAGTGPFHPRMGRRVDRDQEIYRHVMRSGRTFFLTDPRQNPLCERCPERETCGETLLVSTPIFSEEGVVGVIGLICADDGERRRLQANQETYAQFIGQMAELLSHKLSDQARLQKTRTFLDLMIRIVDVNNRGIIIFNTSGGVTYLNPRAREDLGIPDEANPTGLSIVPTGNGYSDFEEYKVTVNGRETVMLGHLTPLPPQDPHFGSVFVSDPLTRITRQISDLTASNHPYEIASLIGHSRGMTLLKKQIHHIAKSPSTVLITGETGTGKELVARAIHRESDRRDKPFIAINCGAIPDTLLYTEFFGYSRGAFTGADPKGKIGKFELANGGILFLDEVGSLPIYLQAKLLRVLQERHFTRVGSNQLIHVDVRIIAATNETLLRLIEEGRFRKDLFYRLNVIPLDVPPLRERLEDIPVLVEHFFRKYCALLGKPPASLDPALFSTLQAYTWPGNVRELENVIEFMVNMMPDTGPLDLEALPPYLHREERAGNSTLPMDGEAPDPMGAILPLATLERQAIATALKRYGKSTKGKRLAADALRISIATLYRKIREYDLSDSAAAEDSRKEKSLSF